MDNALNQRELTMKLSKTIKKNRVKILTFAVIFTSSFFFVFEAFANCETAYKTGTINRQTDDASGTQIFAHGLGFQPTIARFYSLSDVSGIVASVGFYDGTTNYSIYQAQANHDTGTSTTYSIYSERNSTVKQYASASFDATNITLTWTKVGDWDVSKTLQILWEVEGQNTCTTGGGGSGTSTTPTSIQITTSTSSPLQIDTTQFNLFFGFLLFFLTTAGIVGYFTHRLNR